jgi:triacylglycerol lipase
MAAAYGVGEEALWPWPPFVRPSLWLEQRALFELAELFVSPVYYGAGVPRGDGSPVLLLPGFLGSDGYLSVMSAWLRRVGYRPHASGLTVVVGSPLELFGRVLRRADALVAAADRRLTVIGHSLGGVLGRVLARLRPDLVRHVVALGAPLGRQGRAAAHPLVRGLAHLLVREGVLPDALARERQLERELTSGALPAGVRLTSIYSREDAVVDWRACIDADPRAAAVEVRGTHIGLAWNAEVYRHIGHVLPAA